MLNKACHVDQLFLFDLLMARPVGPPALPADYIYPGVNKGTKSVYLANNGGV